MGVQKILIGVSGGIAAYKVCEVVRLFVKADYEVKVVMTENAKEFVRPLTFEVLSKNPVPRGMFESRHDPQVSHIEISAWCDHFLIAPATANIIGKLASGIADDLLTTMALALPSTVTRWLAPAMNSNMWKNSIVQKNMKTLCEDMDNNYQVIDPVKKELACGDFGVGGLADPESIVNAIVNHKY